MSNLTGSLMNASIGRYELRERLGTGGMARVFKGYDANLDRTVAIKILHDHLVEDGNFKERFEREAKFVAGLNHPNIVQVYDFNSFRRDDNDIYYMVMSYIPGPTLQHRLEHHRQQNRLMPHDDVLTLMTQLTDALGYAHQRGAVHRDVKPANILLNEKNEAILTDFGIARLVEANGLTQEGATVGTPTYMSPEQATGLEIDARSDLYALGIILYEMLTGAPPFEDDGTLSVLLKHLNDPVPSLSEHHHIENPYLDAVIFKALAKDPNERYQTAQAFANDLKNAFAGQMPERSLLPPSPITTTEDAPTPERNQTIQLPTPKNIQEIEPFNPPTAGALPNRLYAPVGILIIGLLIIGGLGVFGALNSDDSGDTQTQTINNNDISAVDSMTGMTGNLYFTSNFDPDEEYLQYWAQDERNMLVREITEDGFYRIDSDFSARAIATVFGVSSAYTDISIEMTALLDEDSSTTSGYGIVFRYVDDENYNVFAVDGMGRYSIWVREDGIWRELRDEGENWTSDQVVMEIGTLNTLTLEIAGNAFYGYVNGELVTTVMDDTIATGDIGIYLASPENGNATVLVDHYQVMEGTISSADSMTGDN